MSARLLGVCAAAMSGMLVAAAPARAELLPPVPDVIGSVTGAVPPLPALPGDPVGEIVDGLPGGIQLPGTGTTPTTPAAPVVAVPPASFTGSAGATGSDRVTVTGLVVPGTAAARYAFEYGPTTGYGARTPEVELPASVVPSVVSATLTGLPPGSTVHYRLVAASAAGASAGLDRAVTLQPAPALLEKLLAAVRGDGTRPAPGGSTSTGGGGGAPVAAEVQTAAEPVVGAASDLTVQTASGRVPVSGIVADFDEEDARIGALACRQEEDGSAPREGPLAPNGTGTFALSYAYRRGGAHDMRIDLLGGTCGSEQRTLRTLRSRVTPTLAARAKAAVAHAEEAATAAAGRDGQCADADLRPTPRNLKRVERAVRCLLARERAAHRLPPLRPSHRLSMSARRHTGDMVRKGYLAHARPGGPRLQNRLRAAGYGGAGGECIGLGSGPLRTPKAIVHAWMGSTVHRDVILRRRYRAVGIGVVPRAPMRMGQRAATYTANFGTSP